MGAEALAGDDECVDRIVCRPFIKWAGGKQALLPELLRRVPTSFKKYYEPFLGGGALYFALQPEAAFLSDSSAELINAFQVVKDKVEPLICDLGQHVYERDYYYWIRKADRMQQYQRWTAVRRASRFIYLNKTCYNGLFRVNSRGEFNVPFGRYSNPKILDEKNLRACSSVLSSAELDELPFEEAAGRAEQGDFVYFDPPYVPVSSTANFTSYGRDGFGPTDHERLRDVCRELTRKGVFFMLSNSGAPLVHTLFKEFRILTVQAPRAINSKAGRRGSIAELVITNY